MKVLKLEAPNGNVESHLKGLLPVIVLKLRPHVVPEKFTCLPILSPGPLFRETNENTSRHLVTNIGN